jgi:hypothetical protein
MSINYNEYINKIIEVGKKELCTSQDLDYFLANIPDVGNRELRNTLQRDYKINTGHITRREFLTLDYKINKQPLLDAQKKIISFLTNLIKGCHLIEIRYGGFGSTTNICNLFASLIGADVNKAIDLYNWIAFNGGNYYIEPNIAHKEARKVEQWVEKSRIEKLLNDQKIRSEAITRRKNMLYLHTKKSNETRKLHKECKEMFQKMDDKQLVKTFKQYTRDRHPFSLISFLQKTYNLYISKIALVVAVGYPHHITQRGNYRQKIFADDSDRRKCLSPLKEENSTIT